MALDIRGLTTADLDTADALLMAAYGGASRRRQLEMYLELQPDGWLLALWDGAPAGVAGITHFGPMAYIGLVGVEPAYQRRGIAMAMMRYLLAWSAEHGSPVLQLDASLAGAPLYDQLGFADDGKTFSFSRDDDAVRPPISERIGTLQAADIPALAVFDAPIFGADRAAVFDLLWRRAPERAFVARDSAGKISGYLFAQPSGIGPWVARSHADAEALLGAALQLDFAGGPIVLAPSVNPNVGELLQRYGFSATRALRHMRLGSTGSVGQRELLYGLASFAIG